MKGNCGKYMGSGKKKLVERWSQMTDDSNGKGFFTIINKKLYAKELFGALSGCYTFSILSFGPIRAFSPYIIYGFRQTPFLNLVRCVHSSRCWRMRSDDGKWHKQKKIHMALW